MLSLSPRRLGIYAFPPLDRSVDKSHQITDAMANGLPLPAEISKMPPDLSSSRPKVSTSHLGVVGSLACGMRG